MPKHKPKGPKKFVAKPKPRPKPPVRQLQEGLGASFLRNLFGSKKK